MFSAFVVLCTVVAHSQDIHDVTFEDCKRINGKPIHKTVKDCVNAVGMLEFAMNAPAMQAIREAQQFPYRYPKLILKRGGCAANQES